MARATRTAAIITALFIVSALTATAQVSVEVQLHGVPLIGMLHTQLATIDGYTFRNDTRKIMALDRVTGEEVYTITHPDHSCLTFTGAILRLQAPTVVQRERLRREIDRFNGSAAVGTMYYNERTGDVELRHHLDPGQTGIGAMIDIARRFGDQVKAERANLEIEGRL
jgi:hypothetical protein